MNENLGSVAKYLDYVGKKMSGNVLSPCVARPSFYLVCPCCSSQDENLGDFDDSGTKVCFGNITNAQGIFKYPFEKPITQGFGNYYELVDNLQQNPPPYLTEAWKLYQARGAPYYRAHKNNKTSLFILSPCWGLVRADFCLPHYNFEFALRQKAKQLDSHFRYIDDTGADLIQNWSGYGFNHLESDAKQNPQKPIVVLGGKCYILRFRYLYCLAALKNPVYALIGDDKCFNILNQANLPNWNLIRVNSYTNWHYNYMKNL